MGCRGAGRSDWPSSYADAEGWGGGGGGADGAVSLDADGMWPAATEARALVEARFLSMRRRAIRAGLHVPPKRLLVTGGASVSRAVCQVTCPRRSLCS